MTESGESSTLSAVKTAQDLNSKDFSSWNPDAVFDGQAGPTQDEAFEKGRAVAESFIGKSPRLDSAENSVEENPILQNNVAKEPTPEPVQQASETVNESAVKAEALGGEAE